MSRFNKAQRNKQSKETIEALGPATPVVELPVDPLVWEQKDGIKLKIVDLTIYRDGDEKKGFTGRPKLIHELAPVIRREMQGNSHSTIETKLIHITKFFKYLDKIARENGRNIESCHDIGSADANGFKYFLLRETKGETLKPKNVCLNYIATCVGEAVNALQGQNGVQWPTIDTEGDRDSAPKMHRDVDLQALKAVYNTAQNIHDESLRYHDRGLKGLKRGTDPRTLGQTGRSGRTDGRRGGKRNMAWYRWRNILVLFHDRIWSKIIKRKDIAKGDVTRVKQTRFAIAKRASEDWPTATPENIYRMIAPSEADTMAAYALVSMHTGWMDTARAITVVDENFEECDDWYTECTDQLAKPKINQSFDGQNKNGQVIIFAPEQEDQEQDQPETIEIRSVRPKTKRLHSAHCLKASRYQPFAVIKAQIERTRYLRDLLREARAELLKQPQTREVRIEIAMIEQKLQSPWIFWGNKGTGHNSVGLLGVSTRIATSFNADLRSVAIDDAEKQGKGALVKSIEALQPGDIRDGYAAFVYDESGGNIFAVQGILNHRHISSTRHYLRQKGQINERFKRFGDLAQAIFEETSSGRPVDPAILWFATSKDGVTEEDRALLASHRVQRQYRSAYGMGCEDPLHPPADIAPNHVKDTLCQAQRCILCPHARFTIEALDLLAERNAELLAIKDTSSDKAFLQSSLYLELQGIEMIRDALQNKMLAQEYDDNVARVLEEIQSGARAIFGEVQLNIALEIAINEDQNQ